MEDSVDHDIGILGKRNWRNLALKREEGRKVLKKARAVEPMMMMNRTIRFISIFTSTRHWTLS
jgi:hypothetical protein